MKNPTRFIYLTAHVLGVIFISSLINISAQLSHRDIKTLSNEQLTIRVKGMGAELSSIVANTTGREYLWQGNPAFWKRQSPILFPIVGSLWNNEFRHQGETYTLPLHGFARDKHFQVVVDEPSEVLYRLESDEETLTVYPFSFSLEIGYRLKGNRVEVLWSVKNRGKEVMYFQIGAHPGFNYPDLKSGDDQCAYLAMGRDSLEYRLVGDKGCLDTKTYSMPLKDGILPLDTNTFDRDALIFEGSQLNEIALLDSTYRPYLSLHFNAPVICLWSPPGKKAPFVCIEPCFGRCDRIEYTGEFNDRDWIQALEPDSVFNASYSIEVASEHPHAKSEN